MPYLSLEEYPEIVAYNPTSEYGWHGYFGILRQMESRGIRIIAKRDLSGVGTFGGLVQEVRYLTPDEKDRWVYICPQRLEVDAEGEDSLICSSPIQDDNRVADAFLAAREATLKQPSKPA